MPGLCTRKSDDGRRCPNKVKNHSKKTCKAHSADELTEERIQQELELSKNFTGPMKGDFQCSFCRKEMPLKYQSKEKPTKCVWCAG